MPAGIASRLHMGPNWRPHRPQTRRRHNIIPKEWSMRAKPIFMLSLVIYLSWFTKVVEILSCELISAPIFRAVCIVLRWGGKSGVFTLTVFCFWMLNFIHVIVIVANNFCPIINRNRLLSVESLYEWRNLHWRFEFIHMYLCFGIWWIGLLTE